MDMDAKVRRLVDRAEIQDVMLRYCRGVDRREWDLIRDAFHEDAHDDHGPFRGDVEGLIDWVARRHAHIEQSMHFIGNSLIEFADDDTALVETYFAAFQRLGPASGESKQMLLGGDAGNGYSDISVLGRYIDRFERRKGQWKIANRLSLFEAIPTQPVPDPSQNPDYNWHTRTRTDPLFKMMAKVFGDKANWPVQ